MSFNEVFVIVRSPILATATIVVKVPGGITPVSRPAPSTITVNVLNQKVLDFSNPRRV